MDYMEMLIVMSNMTAAEHKAMQKALRVLMNVGFDQPAALSHILPAMKYRKESLRREYVNRRAS